MINCIAIDDEPLALTQLTGYISRVPFLNLVASCQDAFDAMSVLSAQKIDLMFVDINMPDLNGMDFVRSLTEKPLVIFTTAYSEYAVEGFKVDALDYLLKPFGFQDFLKAVDKAYKWWEFRYSLVTDNGHTPVVTGLLQNIQETKNHEAELIRARQLAERAELKQSFLNNMSHEIRTPLNAIVGFSNLLIDNPDLTDQEKQEFIKLINKNNDLLLKLINDILELSRIDSGSISFTEEELDLRSLLLSYYQTFSLQIKPELEFLQDFPDSDVSVMTDPMRLQQVVTNFLTNANKFTSRGYIKLGYRLLPGGNEVGIFVEDSGKGIPSDELKMIFSRFYKHDEFAQGTGLGLSICQSIVERMQGRIEVDSEEGSGSRFTIVLSLIRSKSNPE